MLVSVICKTIYLIQFQILFPNRLLQTVDRLPLVYIRVLVDYLPNSLLKNMILKAHIIGLKLFKLPLDFYF